jgi:hypothetical protein
MLMKKLILLFFCYGCVKSTHDCTNDGWGFPTEYAYGASPTSHICESCGNGKYARENIVYEQDWCVNCPNGKYSFIDGHTFNTIPGNTACKDCYSPQSTGERSATLVYYSSTKCFCNKGYYLSVPLCGTECSDDGFGGGGGGGDGNFARRLLVGAVDCDNCYPDSAGRDGSMCFQCPTGKYSDTLNSRYCHSCAIGKAQDGKVWDRTQGCVGCTPPRVVNTYTSLCTCPAGSENIWNGGVFEGCAECAAGKYSDIIDMNTNGECIDCSHGYISDVGSTGCRQCLRGKYYQEFADTPADEMHTSNVCRTCGACDPGEYRKNCEFDDPGLCEACPPCDRADEIRIDCLSFSGLNDAMGRCIPKQLVVQTPLCPVNQSFNGREVIESPGLNGFSFRELFGSYDIEKVNFQCRETCVGVIRDTGVCGGPYACNTPACSMGYSQSGESLYRLARACPVKLSENQFENPSLTDTDLYKRRSQQCINCEDCGLTTNVDKLDDWGLGCAEECSRILCDTGEIYDFTDSTCKRCNQLSDIRLCSSLRVQELGLGNKDVTGNGLIIQMDNCEAKTSGSSSIDYGDCKICESVVECPSGEYPTSCTECKKCVSRGFISTENGKFINFENGQDETAFCQLSPCSIPSLTGLKSSGEMCTSTCQDIDCALGEFEIPCVFPHDKRCFPVFPARPASQLDVEIMKAHVNFLEVLGDIEPQFFSSIENIFIPMQDDARFQCVWNAMNILDNSVFPAGISRYFMDIEDAINIYAGVGTKLCHPIGDTDFEGGVTVWRRKPSVQYPMLPLQNTVLINSEEPRRIYTNTSALAIHYDTIIIPENPEKNHYFETKKMQRPFPKLHAFSGDLYLELNLQRTWSAAVGVFIPRDRKIESDRTWPRSWSWSYHTAETTFITVGEDPIKAERPDIQIPEYINLNLLLDRRYQSSIHTTSATSPIGVFDPDISPPPTSDDEIAIPETIRVENNSIYFFDYLQELELLDDNEYIYTHPQAYRDVSVATLGIISAEDEQSANIIHTTDLQYELTDSLIKLQSGNVCEMYVAGLYSISCIGGDSLHAFYSQPNKEIVDFVVLRTVESEGVGLDLLMLQSHHTLHGLHVSLLLYQPGQESTEAIFNNGLDMQSVYAISADDTRLYVLYRQIRSNVVVFTVQTYLCVVTVSTETSVSLALQSEQKIRESTGFAFNDLLRGFTTISNYHTDLFVVAVVRTFSESSINFYMAFVVDNVVIDEDIPASSDLSLILSNQNTFDIECRISVVWRDSNTVIVGVPCYSILYRVSYDSNNVLRYVQIGQSFLMGNYFQVYETLFYLVKSIPMRSIQATSGTKPCAYGYTRVSEKFTEGTEGLNILYCAQECTADSSCVAYNINGQICQKYEESQSESDENFDACKRGLIDFTQSTWRENVLVPRTQTLQTTLVLNGFHRLDLQKNTYARTILNLGESNTSINASTTLFCDEHGSQVSNNGENIQTKQNFVYSVQSYYECSLESFSSTVEWFFDVTFPAPGFVLWLVLFNEDDEEYNLEISDGSTSYHSSIGAQSTIIVEIKKTGGNSLKVFKSGTAFGLATEIFEPGIAGFSTALGFTLNSKISVRYAQEHADNDISVHFRVTAIAQGLVVAQDSVELTSNWQHIRHHIGDESLRNMTMTRTPLRARFTRPLDFRSKNLGRVEDSVDMQRTVAIDNLQLLPLLNTEPAITVNDTRMVLFLDVPTRADLELLDLAPVWRGSSVTWERLHMWVNIRDASTDCSYTAGFIQVNDTLVELDPQPPELHRLGCRLLTDDVGHASCALVMPVSSLHITPHILQINADASCTLPHAMYGVFVSIEPYATLYECAESEFPDIDGVCHLCVSDETQCDTGEYLEGCAALRESVGEELVCKPCPIPPGLPDNSFEWNPSEEEPCRWKCKDTAGEQFFYNGNTCVQCTDSITCNLGHRRDACSTLHDLRCITCEPLKHGTYTDNEIYVPNYECVTQCSPDFHREQVGLVAPCIACDSFEVVQLLSLTSREANTFKRFQQCTRISPAVAIDCRPAPEHAALVGDATEFDADCTYECKQGYQWVITGVQVDANTEIPPANFTYNADESKFYENWESVREVHETVEWQIGRCEECEVPTDMPEDAIYTFDSTCNIHCEPPWTKRNQAPFYCILCDPAECDNGEYLACEQCMDEERSECNICLNCGLETDRRDDNWEFTSHGILDNEKSCDFECKSGYFQSGLDCIQHSIKPVDCNPDNDKYWFEGSSELDAMCLPCGSCEGQKLLESCSANQPVQCESCGDPPRNEMFVGQSCEKQCVPDTVKDMRIDSPTCKYCVHVCLPGTQFTSDRMFCEDCRDCPDTIPLQARWLEDCAWECPDSMEPREQGAEFICVQVDASSMHAHIAEATLKVTCPSHQYLDANYQCKDCDAPTPPIRDRGLTWEWVENSASCEWVCIGDHLVYASSPRDMHCITWDQFKELVRTTLTRTTRDFDKPFRRPRVQYERLSDFECALFVLVLVACMGVIVRS